MIFLSFNKICCVKTVFFSFFFFFFFFPSSSSSFFFSTLCVLSEWKQFGCQVIYQHLSVSQYQTDNLHSDICIPNIDININVRIVNPNKVAKSTLKLASKCTIKGRPDICKTQLYETGTKCKEGKSDQTWEHQWKSTSQNSCLSLGHVNMPHFQLTVGSSSFDFA